MTVESWPPVRFAFLAGAIALSCICREAAATDLEAAKAQFLKSCGTCHTVDKGAPIRQGPNLGTAFGRKAGSLEEFPRYSSALKKAGADGLVWTEDKLDLWITNAVNLVPGATMPYRQADPDKRKLAIDYLKSLPQ